MSKSSKFALPETEVLISEETAMGQVMKLLIKYNIDIEEKKGREKKAFEETIQRVLKDIMSGRLEVFDEDNKVKVKQIILDKSKEGNRSELIYGQMTTSDHEAMSHGEDVSEYTKMFDLLGSMCETNGGDVIVRKLSAGDAKTAENLALIFL